MKLNYKISMYYDDYLKYHEDLIAQNLISQGNSIIFNTNKETIKHLDINNINYVIENNILERIKSTILLRKMILITLILIIFSVYMNTYRVSDINFNINTPINEQIKSDIEATYKKLMFFNFTTYNYQELSKDLRSKYTEYEWISINKEYDTINVDIIKTGLNNELKDDFIGNVVAIKDAIIESYIVHNGTLLVAHNDYVKKGDILIEGKYSESLVSPKGIILGHTFEEETYKINKIVKDESLTGKVDSFYGISIFNKSINLKKTYRYSINKEEKKLLFKIPYLFNLYKIDQYEKNDIIYNHDEESAINYGYTLIEENFIKNKVVDEEKLESNQMLYIEEYETYYEITYLVKKLESIGKFEEM